MASLTASPTFLTNSTTKVLRSSYARGPAADPTLPGSTVPKSTFVQQLNLQPGDVEAVKESLAKGDASDTNWATTDAGFWSLLQQFEGTPLASGLPPLSAFYNIKASDLVAFGNGLVALRQQAVQRLQPSTARSDEAKTVSSTDTLKLGAALIGLNTAHVAMNGLTASLSASPIGWLNLERLEMTPAGVERGALIATVPLAPKERTFVVQKEWSVTTQDFTSIVTDSLDNYSETGVTENTQLAQSTTSQVAHNSQSNITASASGGANFVFVSGSASGSTSFTTQDQNSQSATNSRQDAIQTTRQASSRVRQSHKTTISTTTTVGTSESTTRKIENPSATDPIRIDYFSIMSKWYVALYRYGLRLTYDITVPEPGAALRQAYAELAVLQGQASQIFPNPIQYSQITPGNIAELRQLGDFYGVEIPDPPQPSVQYVPSQTATTSSDDSTNYYIVPLTVTFSVNDGQQINSVELNYNIGENHSKWLINILGYPDTITEPFPAPGQYYEWNQTVVLTNFMVGATGSVAIACTFQYANPAIISFKLNLVPTAATMQAWQSTVYSNVYNAAQSQFYAQQQSLNAQITALQAQLNNVDTLTLRREESDEIMKCVLYWMIGPRFPVFMQPAALAAYAAAAKAAAAAITPNNLAAQNIIVGLELFYGVNFTGKQPLSSGQWTALSGNEDIVSFINQAIEWENVVFFNYSYFWDEPACWDFIRQIQHPDKTRQAFLRAGSARVVLTVRPGWEVAWAYFVETGCITLPGKLPSHPYLTIAQQIAAYDGTNYPGIPPANPDGGGLIDDDTPQFGTTCSETITPGVTSATPVIIPVADNSGFTVGATAIIDNWDVSVNPVTGIGIQETQTIVAISTAPAAPSITVQGLQYTHDQTNGPFPIVQAGAKGVLIGEWFEYTPTSGIDIAVNSPLPTIA